MSFVVEEFVNQDSYFLELFSDIKNADTLSRVVLTSLMLGLAIARRVASDILNQRSQAENVRPLCPKCGRLLESKGMLPRSVISLIGPVNWKRRGWRCTKGCRIGQVTPFDKELGLQPSQRMSNELKQISCALAVFVPYSIASSLLKMLTGTKISSGAIWNWVQDAGQDAMIRLEDELSAFEENSSELIDIESKFQKLPLIIGGDGVMVPFRPHTGSPKGKTAWREVKVGIFARLGQRVTRKGKAVSVLVHRHLVAVLGNIDEFKIRMQVHGINLSVAIWVGFLALFGIATDDGVLMATYLDESKARLKDKEGRTRQDIREMVLHGAQRRIRPALMTSATTILALIPILTSTGRGSDIMVPMAIPSFGGMIIAMLTVFVVPVLYCWVEEGRVG